MTGKEEPRKSPPGKRKNLAGAVVKPGEKRRKSRLYLKNRVEIPKTYLRLIRELLDHDKEIGGGILLDDAKKKVVKLEIFPSDDKYSITFNKVYDVEFHTHPSKRNSKVDIALSRIPSVGDIASTMVSAKEEVVITRGLVFKIGLCDIDLFDRTRRQFKKDARVSGQEFEKDYDVYYHYLSIEYDDVKSQARKRAKKSGENTELSRTKITLAIWKKRLRKFGICIERVTKDHALFNIT